ncbi:MAG TPA: phosphoglucosamine mutase [Nitrospinota bacterium]|nr:phosphoglucosamine mutase [Nitrospinota bacterium]
MRRYFGTDGVRGRANLEPLSPETVFKIGRAAAYIMLQNNKEVKIILGKDTRLSADMLEAAFSAGICSSGGNVLNVGVMPTPGIAYLTKALSADMGVIISASHNPYEDNGIKIFSNNGLKLPDEKEKEIEKLLNGDIDNHRPTGKGIGRIINATGFEDQYLSFVKGSLDGYINLSKVKIVVDCANGATSYIVPKLLRDLGADVIYYNIEPDGKNINMKCGSLYPEFIREKLLENNADLGLTFDGDGDRLITVDEKGEVRDGDFIMAICAKYLIEENKLPNRKIVTTVMSNLGFDRAIETMGGELTKTQIGDRYVIEEMLKTGAYLGGEQSGHIIFLNHHTTGDGVITALQLLNIIYRTKKSLSQLSKCLKKYPQILVNIPINERRNPNEIPEIKKVISEAEKKLGNSGRVLVRLSGTEQLIRVMLEGRDKKKIDRIGKEIAKVVKKNFK